MSFYDAFPADPSQTARPSPQYDPGLGRYSYRNVYAEDPMANTPSFMDNLKAMKAVHDAQSIAASNPQAEANREIQQQEHAGRKGLGRLLNIPQLPGLKQVFGAFGALGNANLEAGKEGREGLHGTTTILQNDQGQEVGRTRQKGGILQSLAGIGKGYVKGLTGGAHPGVYGALGGKFAGMALPEAGGGRLATELIGGAVSDPLLWMGAGGAATKAFGAARGAAEVAGGAGLAEKMSQVGFKGLEEGERAKVLAQLEQNAATAPNRFARGTAAERAATTASRAGKYGAEGLHLNFPLVPGASGQMSLAGGRLERLAGTIDQATGVSKATGALKASAGATALRGVVNPRAAIAADKGEEYANAVRDAERRSAGLRQTLSNDAQKVAEEIYKRGNFTPEDLTYARRALDEGTDVNDMVRHAEAVGKPDLADLIRHLHDTTRRGDAMLRDLGIPGEHLLPSGNYMPRVATEEGAAAFAKLGDADLQRLFGKDRAVGSLRQDLERGVIPKQRVFSGNLDQAEAQARAITGQDIQHFKNDPAQAILSHYGNVAGSYAQRQMLRELEDQGLITRAGKGVKGNIDAGDLGGNYEGPRTLSDYLNRRSRPASLDPSVNLGSKLSRQGQSLWKGLALNFPGTAFKHMSGVAGRMGLERVGTRAYRAAQDTAKGIQWAIEHPADVEDAFGGGVRGAIGPGPRPLGELLARNPTPPELPPSRFPALNAVNPTPTPAGAPVNEIPTSGLLRPTGGGAPPLALPPGRGPILPTPEARLRELAGRPAVEGAKVHEPEKLRRYFATMEPGTPNSIQELPEPDYLRALRERSGAPPDRTVVMYDNEGRPVQSIESLFRAGVRGPVDTRAWGHPEFQGQRLATGQGGLWETAHRMGVPLTDQGEGGLSAAGAAGASSFRERLGRPLPAEVNEIPGQGVPIPMGTGPLPAGAPTAPHAGAEIKLGSRQQYVAEIDLDGVPGVQVSKGRLVIEPGADLKQIRGRFESRRDIARDNLSYEDLSSEERAQHRAELTAAEAVLKKLPVTPEPVPSPAQAFNPPRLELPAGPGPKLGPPRPAGAYPAPIQGPPGPAEILAGVPKQKIALGPGLSEEELARRLDALKGLPALPAGPRAPLALPAGPGAQTGTEGAIPPFRMGPPPPRALEPGGGTPLAQWLQGEGYTRPTGPPGALGTRVEGGPGFATPRHPSGAHFGPVPTGAGGEPLNLDALKGLPGGNRVGESRVGQKLRQIAEGTVESPGEFLSPEAAKFAGTARAQGANLPGFTRSMAGNAEIQRTPFGRLWAKKGSILRGTDKVGVEPFEQKARLSLFHKLTAEGMDANQAARSVEDAFFNYSDTSQMLQGARKYSPFISFKVKNIQRTLRDLGEAPGRALYPARVENALMEEKQRNDTRRGDFIQQQVAVGVPQDEAQAAAEQKFGKPSLVSAMEEGRVPIPGTDQYVNPNLPGDTALKDLYLAPRLLNAIGGASPDKNLAGDILSELGGPGPGLAKAIAEENSGQYMFSGGPLKKDTIHNPFVQELLPFDSRISTIVGPRPAFAKALSVGTGMSSASGADLANQQGEVYRAADASVVNRTADDLVKQIRKAEAQGNKPKAEAMRAVLAWIKANPGFVETHPAPASANPASRSIADLLSGTGGGSFASRLLKQTKASYLPPKVAA